MTDPHGELQDPSTTPERLAEIAGSHPELGPWIVAHPNAYPDLREWIAAHPAPEAEPVTTAATGSAEAPQAAPRQWVWLASGVGVGLVVGSAAAVVLVLWVLPGLFGSGA